MSDTAACPVCGSRSSVPVLHRWSTPPVVRCRGCGARRAHPLPTADELRERYREEHDRGKWKERFEAQHGAELRRRAELTTSAAGRPGDVLDVGCGDGRFLDAAAEAGWRTWGLEVTATAAALAARDHRRIAGELACVAARPRFDAVTFWDVLEHLVDPAGAVRDAAARLAPGGVLVASMPNAGGTTRALMGPDWRYYDFESYGHVHHLAPRHLRTLMEAAGLRVVRSETRGSTDLREVAGRSGRTPGGAAAWVLDKASGLLARAGPRLGAGDTVVVIGRKPA